MSTKGRKTTTVAVAEKPVIDHDEVQLGEVALSLQAEQQHAAQENALVLAGRLGYEGALTVGGLEDEIKFYQRRSVEAVLETGKRLLLLKEIVGHGGFIGRLEALGIGRSLANKLMSATMKFSNAESTTLLSLPNLSQGKMLELLVLDDDEIGALDQGESVRGVKLDDIDCMSVSELRRALRVSAAEHAAELADKDKVIVQKTVKIESLVEDKNRREGWTEAERVAELEKMLNEAVFAALSYLLPVRQAIADIRKVDRCPVGLTTGLENALNRITSEVMGIATDFDVSLSLTPEWLDAPADNAEETGSDWIETK